MQSTQIVIELQEYPDSGDIPDQLQLQQHKTWNFFNSLEVRFCMENNIDGFSMKLDKRNKYFNHTTRWNLNRNIALFQIRH